MLKASEAKELYETPPLTLAEIESAIRDAAKRRNFTCFDIQRISKETRSALVEAGYILQEGSSDLIVNW